MLQSWPVTQAVKWPRINITMEKEIAKKIMDDLKRLEEVLNGLLANIENIQNIEENKKFRSGVGELIGRSYTDIMRPIIREYPELDPDKNLNWNKGPKKKSKLNKVIHIKTKDGT